jgi:hypothetical protein
LGNGPIKIVRLGLSPTNEVFATRLLHVHLPIIVFSRSVKPIGSSGASPEQSEEIFLRSTKLVDVPEFNNESVAAIESTLNDVDRSLERLRLGTYRTCQVCDTPIDEADLVANPLLANCRAHPELA